MQQCSRLQQLLLLAPQRSAVVLRQVRQVSLTLTKMDEAMEHLKANPYFDKYSAKISKVKEVFPAALVQAVSERKATVLSDAQDPLASVAGIKKVSTKAAKGKAPLAKDGYSFAPEKKLQSLMKLELLEGKTKEEVSQLWMQHWAQQPVISGVVEAGLYADISSNAQLYDKFLFPLPREQGYEFILAQFSAQEVHFTPLINYQAYQENAPECLTMVHYTELKEELGVVLMKGEYDSKIISGKEAQFLANQVQLYYSGRDPRKLALLRCFHDSPNSFSHMDVVKELEQLDLAALAK